MYKIAIIGFGVVGGGVADLILKNSKEVAALGGDEVSVKYILDLRDFPDSPLGDRVVHDFSVIVNDPEVKCVVEAMGGSHPAYEYSVAAIKAGKSVVTSNKEVVANFGDELLRISEEMGVCYRFEASVGGGIPIISPLIGFIKQNKISEVRGILNGTTNYILTQMFRYGQSFESALSDAQAKGYAERNPDADILGTDAARKIAILAAIATGELVPVDSIHTEGIDKIRGEDVAAASLIGCEIKLVGRCIVNGDNHYVAVAPFLVPRGEPLAQVNGVFNAVEVTGDPIMSALFYGPGAGAGPTASAIVGDIAQIMRTGTHALSPTFERGTKRLSDFDDFSSEQYVAVRGVTRDEAVAIFGNLRFINAEDECAFVTRSITEREFARAAEKLEEKGGVVLSRIRLMKSV